MSLCPMTVDQVRGFNTKKALWCVSKRTHPLRMMKIHPNNYWDWKRFSEMWDAYPNYWDARSVFLKAGGKDSEIELK